MATNYIGTMSVGACVPIVATAQAQLSIALGSAISQLEGKLAGYLKIITSLSVTLPPVEFFAKIQGITKLLVQLQAALPLPAISLPPPGILAIIAALEAELAGLKLGLSFVAELDAILGAAGVSLYTYSGPADGFGAAFSAAFAGGVPSGGSGSTHANAIVLATTVPSAWASMQLAFRT